jgi:hypothetical protein
MRQKVYEYVDVIAMHAYPESWHEQRLEKIFEDWVPKMYALVKQGGSGVDLWLNEAGYPDYRYSPGFATQNHTHVNYAYEHTRAYQAVFLFKMFTLALVSEKLSLAGWYRVDDFFDAEKRLPKDRVHFHLGVLDARHQPKPNLSALQFFNRLFGMPMRRIDARVKSSKPDSQAVIQEIESADGSLLVTGWLRSSEYDEVRTHTGMLQDKRRETVSIPVPCRRTSGLKFYSATGKPRRAKGRVIYGELANIELKGSDIFIARLRCHK